MAVRAVAGSPARSLVRAVSVWAWLTAIVAVSAVARLFFALRIDAPWIVVDELIYSELARGLAAGYGFAIRGVATHGYGLVYPLVIAPAYLLFDRALRLSNTDESVSVDKIVTDARRVRFVNPDGGCAV